MAMKPYTSFLKDNGGAFVAQKERAPKQFTRAFAVEVVYGEFS